MRVKIAHELQHSARTPVFLSAWADRITRRPTDCNDLWRWIEQYHVCWMFRALGMQPMLDSIEEEEELENRLTTEGQWYVVDSAESMRRRLASSMELANTLPTYGRTAAVVDRIGNAAPDDPTLAAL
jgi:hypothetical protein